MYMLKETQEKRKTTVNLFVLLRFEPIREFVLVRRKSMFTYIVDKDIELFGLILSFQFIKELKMKFLFCERNKKNDCVLSMRRKF